MKPGKRKYKQVTNEQLKESLMVCRRLQLQERIGKDIAEIIALATNSIDVIVAITAEHSCVAARGIKKQNQTKTVFSKGVFLHDKNKRIEFLQCIE